jgi:hypothetical protein
MALPLFRSRRIQIIVVGIALGLGTLAAYIRYEEQRLDEFQVRVNAIGNPLTQADENRIIQQKRVVLARYNLYLGMGVALVVGLGSIPTILEYLRAEPDRRSSERVAMLVDQVNHLKQSVLANRTVAAGFDEDKLMHDLRKNIVEQVATELESRYRAEAHSQLHVSLMRNMFRDDSDRLLSQISVLRRRSNLNLAIGVSTTLVAAGLLVYMIVGANFAIHDTQSVIAYYVPRVSTVIFVEVFSFFFLRLYKATLAEEKYYQNEITARTARQTALEAALNGADEAAMIKLIENLSLVNQNRSTELGDSSSTPNLKDLAKIIESAAKIMSSTAQKAH